MDHYAQSTQEAQKAQKAQKAQEAQGIHPVPTEFSTSQIIADPILHFFHYAHLPPKLQATSRIFFMVASHVIQTLPRNAERTIALRKLLEAKDAAVRSNMPTPGLPTYSEQRRSERMVSPLDFDEDRDGPIPFEG